MEEQRIFGLEFLKKEAECWTKSELNDVQSFNKCVQELYAMATDDMDEAFGVFEEDELDLESEPTTYNPGYLFKLSKYSNREFGNIWVAYTSYKNPFGEPNNTSFARAFIISKFDKEFKIIGVMSVALNESTLEPVGWKKSVYNPPNLNIHDLGEFIAAERYFEPKDDGFSLQDYLADK